MSNAPGTMEELSTLRREVDELKESRMKAAKEGGEQKTLVDSAAEGDSADAGSEKNDEHDIVGQLEKYLKEIEDAARERPALALLTTFVAGVIVGQIFSRK